jgi:hypothetical protein
MGLPKGQSKGRNGSRVAADIEALVAHRTALAAAKLEPDRRLRVARISELNKPD